MTLGTQPFVQWEAFSDKLLHHFIGKTGNRETAQDLRQETILKILENKDSLINADKQWAWIWTIARNVLADHWRSQGMAEVVEVQDNDPEMEELAKLARMCIQELIDKLPEKYREPLVLAEFEGMKQKDVAKKLGLSESGAKSRIQRGRKLLKEMMFDCCTFSLNKNGQWKNDKWQGCAG